MLKQLFRYTAAFLFLGMIVSCSSDPLPDMPLAEGDVPVRLTGMLTRAALNGNEDGELVTSGYPLEDYRNKDVKFYLTARTVDLPALNYFLSREIQIGDHGDSEGRNKLTGTVYYPLGEKAINLYAHTVVADENGDISLTAGTALANDVLLGKGTEEDGEDLKSGTSKDPIEYITFRHLMTRVDVKIEVASDVEVTTPQNITMNFVTNENSIVRTGRYNIFDDGYKSNTSSGAFGFTFNATEISSNNPKTYYLVSNGANLTEYSKVNKIFSSLIIDHYTASEDDLAALEFSKAKIGDTGPEVDFELKPGLAYDLIFKINRLRITEIKLTLKNWDPKGGNTEWGYEPKTFILNTGTEYISTSEDDKITQMVLKYDYNGTIYQYIGEGKLEDGVNTIDFVTLPAGLSSIGVGKLTADLYTKDGLLVDGVEIDSYDADELKVLDLGKYGMKKDGDVYEISTPLQFVLMVNDEDKGAVTYRLVKDLDMNNNSVKIEPTAFPSGSELDGAGHDILNLYITGDGLFTENKGTLKDFRIASGQITGSGSGPIGAICQTNNGTIEAVVNEANIRPASGQTVVGGISGVNGDAGKILATVNTGNILGGTTVGGIVGSNENTASGAITACLNVGLLNKNVGDDGYLGGIAGASEGGTSIVNTCFWLTGTARKDQALSGELAIGNNPAGAAANSADLAASVIRDVVTIGKLNTALTDSSPWKFELDTDKSSWPIAKPK